MGTAERVKGQNTGTNKASSSLGGAVSISPVLSSRRVEVKDASETILLETTGSWNEIKAKYSFIVEEAGLIKADFSNFKFEKESSGNLILLNFFKELFNKGFYIKGLYENLEILNAIYDVKYFKQEDSFKLGSSIARISKEDVNIYGPIKPAGKNEFAEYEFLPSQPYDRDKFIANLYKNGVVYGYNKKGIEDGIEHSHSRYNQGLTLIIAKQKEPIHGIDARKEIISDKVKEDFRARAIAEKGIDSKDAVDHFDFANATCSVEAGIKIIKKIPATTGEPGRNVLGKVVPNIPGADKIILSDMIGEGLEVKTDESGEEYIFTSRAGKLQEDRSTKKYFVTEGYKFNEIDHKHTGDIILVENENYSIKGDIQQGRKITGNCGLLEIGGDVFGIIKVSGNTEIIIKGNLSGKARIIHEGTGKITIEGKIINGALLDARKSSVNLGALEIGNVLVKKLELETFSAGNIVAKIIKIKDFSTRPTSKVSLVGENIDIKNFNSPGVCKVTLMSKFVDALEKSKSFDTDIALKKEEIKKIILYDFKSIKLNLSDPFLLDDIDSISPDIEKYIKLSNLRLKLLSRNENEVPSEYKATVQSLMTRLPKAQQNYSYDFKRQRLNIIITEKLNLVKEAYKNIKEIYDDIAKIKETMEQIDNMGTNSSLKIDKPTSSSTIELYSYETNGKDFYELIDNDELKALIKGERVIDGISLSRINFKLGTLAVDYSPTKKEA